MSSHPRHEPTPVPAPIAAWLHVLLGVGAIVTAYHFAWAGKATIIVLAAIAYVAWTAGRATGIGLALVAGAIELAQTYEQSSQAIVFGAALAIFYVLVALLSASIETATRPDND